MIIDFHDFLNESDDIRKRLEDRINKAFDKIRVKYPNPNPNTDKTEPLKGSVIDSGPVQNPPTEHKPMPIKGGVIDSSGDEGEEPEFKPKKQKFSDRRLDDAYYALMSMGYVEKNVKDFLESIILTDKVTATSIVRSGINNFRKLIG